MSLNCDLSKQSKACILNKHQFTNWEQWLDKIVDLKGDWLYRGQYSSKSLESSLESDCKRSGFSLDNADKIENHMIRHFKRVYDREDSDIVKDDTLYCLSLMRHYGAPTRLLDFSYSKYLATYFALEAAYRCLPNPSNLQPTCTVWCINQQTLYNKTNSIPGVNELLQSRRSSDKNRRDNTFWPLYMENKFTFASWENPMELHKRLHLQQGTFLCPGSIKTSLMNNLLIPFSDTPTKFIYKFTCHFTPKSLQKAFLHFRRMGITRESLFPGLDGLAQSMTYQLCFYHKLDYWVNRELRFRE